MIEQLVRDVAAAPGLFEWNGPVSPQTVRACIREAKLNIPDDLIELWAATGGGEMFESETLLPPPLPTQEEGEFEEVNSWLKSRGMSKQYAAFSDGVFLSAVRQDDGSIVELDSETFEERAEFSSLEEWYCRLPRKEFADRYNLPPPPAIHQD